MKSLVFTNNNDIRVEYVVDLLGSNSGNITVMEIKGLDTTEEALFMGFQKLPNSLAAFKAFATANNLQLTEADQDNSTLLLNNTSTATFDTDGGSTAPAAQTVASGSLLTAPSNPTKALFIFGGWSIDEGTTIWNFATNKITVDIALVAQWTAA